MKFFLIFVVSFICLEAHAADIQVDKLLRAPEFTRFMISPDGRLVAGMRIEEDNYSVIISNPAADRNYEVFRLHETEKSGIKRMLWIDNNSFVIHYDDLLEVPHFLILDITYDNGGRLQFKDRNVVTLGYILDGLVNEPDTVMFAVGAARHRFMDVYRVDLREIDRNYVFTSRLNKGVLYGLSYLPDKHKEIRIAAEFRDSKVVYLYRKKDSNSWRVFYENEEKDDRFQLVGFIDEDTIAVITDADRDKAAVVEYKLKEKRFGQVLYESDAYDVFSATIDPHTGKLKFVIIMVNGRPTYKYFRSSDSALQQRLQRAFPGKDVLFYDSSLSRKKLIVLAHSPTDPGSFYLLDVESLKTKPLANVFPDLNAQLLSPSQPIAVTAEDGLKIEGTITLPKKYPAPHPLVVMPHGGPIGIRDYDTFDPEVQFLADRGYAVLQVNFRGSGGYGKSFLKKGLGQWGQEIENDINASVDHVLAQYPIDKARIAIMGASYGGYSSLMSVIRFQDKYRCAVSRFGVSDVYLWVNQSNRHQTKGYQAALATTVGDLIDSEQDMMDVSPFHLAEQINVPVLLTAGWRDARVDPEQTHRMKIALDLLGKENEYVLFKEAGHGHPKWDGDQCEWIIIEQFLRKHLDLAFPMTQAEVDLRTYELTRLAEMYEEGKLTEKDNEKAAAYRAAASSLSVSVEERSEGEQEEARSESSEEKNEVKQKKKRCKATGKRKAK
ncbi:MAG: prolyl oligopeptidase family serine peptidase [Myxococcota bacterium]|nr:prolyl oligopeptidase family serine peptidase [Myxococcota bacterium]